MRQIQMQFQHSCDCHPLPLLLESGFLSTITCIVFHLSILFRWNAYKLWPWLVVRLLGAPCFNRIATPWLACFEVMQVLGSAQEKGIYLTLDRPVMCQVQCSLSIGLSPESDWGQRTRQRHYWSTAADWLFFTARYSPLPFSDSCTVVISASYTVLPWDGRLKRICDEQLEKADNRRSSHSNMTRSTLVIKWGHSI